MSSGETAAPAASSHRLLNATAIMAAGTMISRILGFVKAALLVIVLGAGSPQADVYQVATLVPNSLYMLLAGGALNTVLVPQIVRHTKSDSDGGEAFINRIMTAFLIVLAAATLLIMVFIPYVLSLWTDAAWREPAMAGHWNQLVLLGLLTMPQLFFYGAFFLVGQVLNSRDRFGPMMWAPILNNVVAIAVLGLYVVVWGVNAQAQEPFTDQQVLMLGLGSTLGIVVQTLALVPAMRSIGFRYRPRFDLKGQGLGETFHLAKWMLGYVLLTTLVQIVVSKLATGATGATGADPDAGGAGLTVYNTAYLVWILPHSLLTVSLATAMLPSASRLAATHDLTGVAAETTRTLRLALTFLVPSSVAFLVLGLPFARLAFGHGANTEGWVFIGWTLAAFAVGLVPYTIQYVLLRGFYALEDTRSVFFLQVWISLANVALAIGFVALWQDPATVAPRLALAYSLAYSLGAWLTFRALSRPLPDLNGNDLVRHVTQLLLAVLPGAVVAAGIAWWTVGGSFLTVLLGFLGALLVAGLSFFFVAKRMGLSETSQLIAVLRRRGGRGPADADAPVPATEATVAEVSEVSEDALLTYPDPHDPTREPQPAASLTEVPQGTVLENRYRLDEALNRRGSTVTWRGWDLVLSRPVLLHLLDPDEPRTLDILDQARRTAPAIDARFLRVWDAVLDERDEAGSFIVCEYAAGRTLERVLRDGPLEDVEAAWVVHEVAAALAGMHGLGLHHQRLNPSTVVITTSGNVKVVGFLVEHALHPGAPSGEDPERTDVLALGELLYATATGRWPGPARHGLPAAPTDADGRPVLPARVSTRVSAELSAVADRILSPVPRDHATPLRTAAEVAEALSVLLGGADASRPLAQRVARPVDPPTPAPTQRPGGEASAAGASVAGATVAGASVVGAVAGEGVPGRLTERVPDEVDPPPSALRARQAQPASPWGSADEAEDTASSWLFEEDADDELGTEPFTPIPPPVPEDEALRLSEQAPVEEPSRRWLGILLLAFVAVLIAGLVGVFLSAFERSRATPPAPGEAWPIVASRDFDPRADGGDDEENPQLVPFAVDADPATRWTTERYGRSADFNGRKPGAGIVVDLGKPEDVNWVVLNVGSGATTGEILVPLDPETTQAPMGSVRDWRRVAEFAPSTGEVRLRLEDTVQTRFVLVYLTGLPREGPNFVGGVHEVRVTG